MPIKRHLDEGRPLDAYRRDMLRDVPHAMLLAGDGYLGEMMVSHYAKAPPMHQKVILEAMRADWQRHRDRLLADGDDWWAAYAFSIDEVIAGDRVPISRGIL